MNDTQQLPHQVLRIHPEDNLGVALTSLAEGDQISVDDWTYTQVSNVPAKHKFATAAVHPGEKVTMYGVQVGKATAALAEFPELCGVEQNLINRNRTRCVADRFIHLMRAYAARARADGSGFDMNPSPGNIKDGLLSDAMKSAGAAKKGGASPVADVPDYPEHATEPGLSLLCTPGSDVEAVTTQVGAGSHIVVFTSRWGTPTGNPIAPVMKLSTYSALANGMSDIIDFDCGAIASGGQTLEETGEVILTCVIAVASGEKTKAQWLRPDDFIPWKRGVSL